MRDNQGESARFRRAAWLDAVRPPTSVPVKGGRVSQQDSQDPKDLLESNLVEAREKGLRLAKLGLKIASAGQGIADLAEATRRVAHIVPSPPNIESMIGGWSLTSSQQDAVLSRLDDDAILSLLGTSGSTAVYSTDLVNRSAMFSITPAQYHPLLDREITNLDNVLTASIDLDALVQLMERFGLNEAPEGRKSPVELLRTAHSAYQTPVQDGDPASTSLIPLREAIRSTIAHLLRLRPKQEKAASEWTKIVSIGTQLRREGTPQQIVSTWASQWSTLLDKDLSPAKQQGLSRDEWRARLLRGTLLLRSFLSGLDPGKVR